MKFMEFFIEVGIIPKGKGTLFGWTTFIEAYDGQWGRMRRLRRRVKGLSDNEAADMLNGLDRGTAGIVVVAQEERVS